MKETIVYEEMCERCQEWYREQHSGATVQDFLIVCNHQLERSKREDLTSTSPLPKDLEKHLVENWKKELLS